MVSLNWFNIMEEGTRTKKTIFIGGISDEVDEGVLIETFATFGELLVPPSCLPSSYHFVFKVI